MTIKTVAVVLCAIITIAAASEHASMNEKMACRGNDGTIVEWFIALKMSNGYDYIYMDSRDTQDWKMPVQTIQLETSPLMRTLKLVQKVPQKQGTNQNKDLPRGNFGAIFWNDQPPGTTDSKDSKAHSKGVMGFDQSTGFLLIHSTPRFPTISNISQVDIELIKNQTIYGQHFFCTSMESTVLNQIAEAYLVNDVFVYAGGIPQNLIDKFPKLNAVLINQYVRVKDKGFSLPFTSLFHKFNFTILAKSMAYAVPFYNNVVVPIMGSGIITETWGNGVAQLQDPYCNTDDNSVISNLEINVKGKYSYTSTKDHSKYGISMEKENPFVCLGDINRQASQYQRGGGTLCFVNYDVWSSFRSIMVRSQQCDNLANEPFTWKSTVKELLLVNPPQIKE